MKYRKIGSILVSLALALAMIPFAAFAASEDVLESAPAMTLPAETPETEPGAEENDFIPYLPYEYTYFTVENGTETDFDELQYLVPRLTAEETERVRGFLADPAAAEKAADAPDCLDRMENAAVGVYTLDPKEYYGESFYVMLPASRLTDEMLLSLISAFGRLGVSFDPELLNGRNCSRGESQTRLLSYEESVRMQAIRFQVHRGMITRESIPEGTACRVVKNEWPGAEVPVYDTFRLYPYRSMTDDELAAYVLETEEPWAADPADVEKKALECLRAYLDAPLALTAADEWMFMNLYGSRFYANDFDIPYADGITGRPDTPDGKPYRIIVHQEQAPGSDELVTRAISVYYQGVYSGEGEQWPDTSGEEWKWPDLSEEEWQAEADRWAAESFVKLSGEKAPVWELQSLDPQDSYVTLTASLGDARIELTLTRGAHTCDICTLRFDDR